jgi:hypothetical protein
MTPAAALLADLRSRAIELQTDGARLRWRPAFLVSASLERLIRSHKADLVALLAAGWCGPACPGCGWPLDAAGRCPRCFDRLCSCGLPTGSYFVARCIPCGQRFNGNAGEPL